MHESINYSIVRYSASFQGLILDFRLNSKFQYYNFIFDSLVSILSFAIYYKISENVYSMISKILNFSIFRSLCRKSDRLEAYNYIM